MWFWCQNIMNESILPRKPYHFLSNLLKSHPFCRIQLTPYLHQVIVPVLPGEFFSLPVAPVAGVYVSALIGADFLNLVIVDVGLHSYTMRLGGQKTECLPFWTLCYSQESAWHSSNANKITFKGRPSNGAVLGNRSMGREPPSPEDESQMASWPSSGPEKSLPGPLWGLPGLGGHQVTPAHFSHPIFTSIWQWFWDFLTLEFLIFFHLHAHL